VEPERIAERVWPGAVRSLEALTGGITNRNFRVELKTGQTLVLRIGGKDTRLLGIDRQIEHAATRRAAELGLAPEVVGFVEPQGYLITRYVEGAPIDEEHIRTPAKLHDVATALRRFHESGAIPGRFDSFRVVEAYHATAAERGVAPPDGFAEAKAIADRVEAARGVQPAVPCHNDLLNANFIADGERLWIVDWEYAGMGDLFFDLANFSANHELSDDQNHELLQSYFGEVQEEDVRALVLMRFMSDFREAMWGVVQQAISELTFDFASYAEAHFERLRETAEDPAFREALGPVSE
jgi:thiamine kinase-like enzyme